VAKLEAGDVGALVLRRRYVTMTAVLEAGQACESATGDISGDALLQELITGGHLSQAQEATIRKDLANVDLHNDVIRPPTDPEPPRRSPSGIQDLAKKLDIGANPLGNSEAATLIRDSHRPKTTGAGRAQRILAETRVAHGTNETPSTAGSRDSSPSVDPHERATIAEGGPGTSVRLREIRETDGVVPGQEQQGGKYVLGQELGRGGMGVVQAALDQDLGRVVAMKSLHPDRQTDETLIRALIGEARVTGQLQHPDIIPVYDLSVRPDGSVFYTMKMVGQTHLYEVLRKLREGDAETRKEYTRLRLLHVFQRVCLALHYAHSRGVVHRDVKPDNVLLGEFGEIQLMDWGIAKVLASPGTSAFTGEGVVAGTPEYMSPEQGSGDDDTVDHRADIYSLGVILYEILTWTVPVVFREKDADIPTLKALPVDLPEVRAPEQKVPPELSAICMKALAHAPEDRHPDARSLWNEIEAFLTGAKERERVQRMAAAEILAGNKRLKRYKELLTHQDELTTLVNAWDEQSTPWDSVDERKQVWDWKNRINALNVVLGREFADAYSHFHRALGHDEDSEGARTGLSELYDSRIEIAERSQDVAHIVYFSDLKRELWAGIQRKPGRLTIRSQPEGAEIFLFASDQLSDGFHFDANEPIGTTPIHSLQVEAGGFVLVARMPGYRDEHESLVVQSGEPSAHMLILRDWSSDVPLVGRGEEFARIRLQHRLMVRRGCFRNVAVCGPSGSGKERVFSAFDEYIGGLPERYLYFYVSGVHSSRFVPYGAFAEVLRHRTGLLPGDAPEIVIRRLTEFICWAHRWPEEEADRSAAQKRQLKQLVSDVAWMPGLVGPKEAAADAPMPREQRQAMHKAVATVIAKASERMPTVVTIRDAEWLDRSSWELLQFLREKLTDCPVLLLTSSDPGVDPHGIHHWSGLDEVILLEPLRLGSVAHLLREVLKGPISSSLVQAIHAHSRGFPYDTEWAVRRVLHSGNIVEENGTWELNEAGAAQLAGNYSQEDNIAERLAALTPEGRDVLEAAAVFGETFWVDALEAIGVKDAASHVHELSSAEFVIRQTQGGYAMGAEYRFRFPTEQSVVQAGIPAERSDAIHERIVQWLEKSTPDDLHWYARRADHQFSMKRFDEVAEACRRIGAAALACGAAEDAIACFSRGVDVAQAPAMQGAVRLDRAHVFLELGRLSSAREDVRLVEDLGEALTEEDAPRLDFLRSALGS
jgi:hypothetical protein